MTFHTPFGCETSLRNIDGTNMRQIPVACLRMMTTLKKEARSSLLASVKSVEKLLLWDSSFS